MRAIGTAAVAAAVIAVSVTGCTSSGTGSAASSTTSTAPTSTAPTSSAPTTTAPTSATSSAPVSSVAASTSSTSRKPTSPSRRPSSTAPAAPTAQSYLLRPADVGGGYKTTTQVDASIPSLCGGSAPDTAKPAKSEAQVGFFDAGNRLLVAEKVSTYADGVTASQVNSSVLAFEGCGSAAKYNGRKATFSAPRDLPADAAKHIDSGAARLVHTSQANVVFETLRKGNTMVQLTLTSIGGTPNPTTVNQLTVKAAQRLG